MGRLYIDCRNYPSEMNCTVAISADTPRELLEASVQHAVSIHGHKDTRELRDQISKLFRQSEA